MNPIISFIKRHPQISFWLMAWSSGYFAFIMNAKYPDGPWMFFLYGTFLGGALVTGIADGRGSLKEYFSRIVRWRVGIQWYAIALFTPLVLRLVAFGLNIAFGAEMVMEFHWPAGSELLLGFLWPSFLGIALAEESGFRGFALPRLLVGRSAFAASLILGVLHAIWHLPLFISGEDPIIVILIIISGAVLNTWLFNKTNGSVLIAMLLHASVDIMVGIFNPLFSGADAVRQTNLLAVAFVVMAILLPLLTGKELGRKPEAALDTMAADQPNGSRLNPAIDQKIEK